MEHTQGPWKISKGTNGMAIIEAEPFNDGRIVAHVFTTMHSEENRHANASLVAAAPDLLEACDIAVHALRAIDHNTPDKMKDSNFWIDMRARLSVLEKAIAKATE